MLRYTDLRAKRFATDFDVLHKFLRDRLKDKQDSIQKYVNQNRMEPPPFQIGDRLFVYTDHIHTNLPAGFVKCCNSWHENCDPNLTLDSRPFPPSLFGSLSLAPSRLTSTTFYLHHLFYSLLLRLADGSETFGKASIPVTSRS